ncbi:helix-turn-helix domain-containing protein [Dyella solisilvae]|uniref:Helix-turn-helix domain-containing protein n=1 Tax=Dyella solisilvae TaxID=1920168 RepID=A0A370K984_9GAMM|nr:helix-turn-helix domain-containing protein [Dyella solisilvae]
MRRLARTRLDQAGDWLRQVLPKLRSTPRGGWVAATRDALGMSQSDLARRLGVLPSSVVKLENSERADTVRVDTLRRAASAMDCELVVLLVPRQPLAHAAGSDLEEKWLGAPEAVAPNLGYGRMDSGGIVSRQCRSREPAATRPNVRPIEWSFRHRSQNTTRFCEESRSRIWLSKPGSQSTYSYGTALSRTYLSLFIRFRLKLLKPTRA